MRSRLLLSGLLVSLALGIGSLACLAEGYILRVGMGEDMPDTMDIWTWNTTARMVVWNVYEGLVTMTHEAIEPKPCLAKSWEISPTGTEYTFHLQEGVRFTDGTAFDAEAVAFNIRRLQEIGLGPARFVKDVIETKIVDDHTVTFKLAKPSAGFLTSLYAVRFVSPSAVAEHRTEDDPWARKWFNDHTVGTGPYTLEEWVRGQYIHLVQNPNYWRGFQPDQPNEIYIILAKEPSTQRLMLETGELDVAPKVTPDDAFLLRSDPNITVEFIDTPVTYQLILNTSKGITSNLLIRRALCHAFNFDAYQTLRKGIPKPLKGPFLPMFTGGKELEGLEVYPYDLTRAKELVELSGYGKDDLVLHVAMTPEVVPEHEASWSVLEEGLRAIGIKPVLHRLPWPTIVELQAKVETSFNVIFYFAASADGTAASVAELLFHSRGIGYRNLGQYRSKLVDDLIDEALATPDPHERYPIEELIARIITEDAAAIFVSQRAIPLVYRSWLTQIDWYPLENYIFNFYGFKFGPGKPRT